MKWNSDPFRLKIMLNSKLEVENNNQLESSKF